MSDVYCSLSSAIVFCTSEIVLSKFAENYFKNELKDRTPFTFRGASELKRLGILVIVVPICATIVASIVVAIINFSLGTQTSLEDNYTISIGLGVMMILMSVICKYGAENSQKDGESDNQTVVTPSGKDETHGNETHKTEEEIFEDSSVDLKVYTDSLKTSDDDKTEN